MPRKEMRTLIEKLRGGGDPRYREFLRSVEAAEAEMRRLNTQDRYGRIPLLTEEDRNILLERFADIAAAHQLLGDVDATEEAWRVAGQIASLAAADHRAILAYDPAQPRSLPTILEDVRTITLDTRGAKLDEAVGNQLSSRQPLTFLDDKGREITGVFTKATYMNAWAEIQSGLEEIARGIKDPVGADLVRGMLDAFYANPGILEQQKLPEDRKSTMLYAILQETANGTSLGLNPDDMAGFLTKLYRDRLGGRRATKKIPSSAVKKICKLFWKHGGDITANSMEAEIPEGARMDTRNAAMSAVADLLGMPGVVARARPMRVILPDGTRTEGTFMAQAKGIDPMNLPEEAQNVGEHSFLRKGSGEGDPVSSAMRQLADLQVLDYICGNVDRHDRNLFYQFNRNYKLCGGQGIDNECALGLLVMKNGEGRKELPGTDSMRVIPQSTCTRVMELTPAMLKFSLQGFGLSQKELDAAGERLRELQSQLEKAELFELDAQKPAQGKLLIVPDNRWKKINYDDLLKANPDKTPGNLFSQAYVAIEDMAEVYQRQKKAYRTLKAAVAIGAGDRTRPQNQVMETQKARQLVTAVSAKASRRAPNQAYSDLLEAVQSYADGQEALSQRIAASRKDLRDEKTVLGHKAADDAVYNAVVGTGDLQELQSLAQRIVEAANAYLEQGNDNASGAKARREAAKLALRMGQIGAVYSKEELDAAERNERLAQEAAKRPEGANRTGEGSQRLPGI